DSYVGTRTRLARSTGHYVEWVAPRASNCSRVVSHHAFHRAERLEPCTYPRVTGPVLRAAGRASV
ncbi:hypothetical protein HAX54_026460, partial [Datura stramonium]|nr:hypothetical protein [Datura stramonium]